MASVENNGEAKEFQGTATILAIGTANPPNCVYQDTYPDFYFKVTNSEHMTELKHKFKRICEKSTIRKRQLYLTEDVLKQNANMCTYSAPSFNARQEMLEMEVPKLGKEAAIKAIEEWNRPISMITHLIFCTTSGVDMPSADYYLVKLLNLNPSVKRYMIYQQGCSAGAGALRLAKDIVENNNNANARVLVVCSELLTPMWFHGPSENHLDILVGAAIFSDGAAAVIVGADPDSTIERPLFQIVSATQTIIPGSDGAVIGKLREMGMSYCLKPTMPSLVGNNIEPCMDEAFSPIGINDWNSLFYSVHPGGRAILDQVKRSLGLKQHKLEASEHILSEYGNMGSPTVFFILDEIRKKSKEQGNSTTGEGIEWGVLIGVGPGLTVETAVLHSVPIVTTQ